MRAGAVYLGEGKCLFRVWAPHAHAVEVKILDGSRHAMAETANGFWETTLCGIEAGARYMFSLDGDRERPDPASNFQPDGVHGPSAVVDHGAFRWEDSPWRGIGLESLILYEVHIGTFTPEGTFEAVVPRLADLRSLGINALEIMPVAQFPGGRNWGYDGSFPYAVQNSYGGPEALRFLVDKAHQAGMAVFLDVVYNHIGPEGNRLEDFGPYYSKRYNGVWGPALNFDGPGSDAVRGYFLENALYWFEEFHIDGLRLDAVDAIFDQSARTFLEELVAGAAALGEKQGRHFIITVENDRNDPRLLRPRHLGGYSIDAQWCDDFHHSLHTLLTGETRGYYADFGRPQHMVAGVEQGYVYQGQYSGFRGHSHGVPPTGCRPEQFIVFSQNHDQVGNRLHGTRLSGQISFEGAKLAAACVMVSPFVPMLFMGEEYGEISPFLFFVDHSAEDARDGAREGRKKAMEAFGWTETPEDPADDATFEKSKLVWERRKCGRHAVMLDFYRELIALRSSLPALSTPGGLVKAGLLEGAPAVYLHRSQEGHDVFAVLNFARSTLRATLPLSRAGWRRCLDSSESRWEGPGSLLPEVLETGEGVSLNPLSAVILEKMSGGGT